MCLIYLFFCETKLSNYIEHLYNIPNYNAYHNNLSRHSGGVSLYINTKLDSKLRPELSIQEAYLEAIFVEISLASGDTIVVGQIYRRPHTDKKMFLDKLKGILDVVRNENKLCIISGDYNIDLLKAEVDNSVHDLIATFNTQLFFNTIVKPTRVTSTSATLIDHIWTNNFNNNIKNGIIYTDISDHFPVFSVFKINSCKVKDSKISITYRDFSEANISLFKDCISNVCWDLAYASSNPNVIYDNFVNIFNACFNKFFPVNVKQIKRKSYAKPYITGEIKSMIAEKFGYKENTLNGP